MSKKCLLILPILFYSFGESLKQRLEALGYDVTFDNDEYPRNLFGRVLGKLGALSLLRRMTLNAFKRHYHEPTHYDLVIIIKGRGIGIELLEFIKTFSTKIVAYNFDSFQYNPSPLDWFLAVDRYGTFDMKDASQYNLPLIHLFSSVPIYAADISKEYDISVLMKNHSNRLRYTDKILSILPSATRFIYIYESSFLSFAYWFLRHPFLYVKYWQYIHFKPLPYNHFLNVLGKSRVTVDYAHPSQTGITIRCFEALSLGVAIITNNSSVLSNSQFEKESVALINLKHDAVHASELCRGLLLTTTKRQLRTVDQFLEELIDVN